MSDVLISSNEVVARPHEGPPDAIRVGFAVSYEELPTGTQRRVTLVNPREVDAGAGRISVLSPVGRALLGRTKGHVIPVVLPMGREVAVRVLEVHGPESAECVESMCA